MPVGALVYWMLQRQLDAPCRSASILAAAGHTAALSAAAAALATAARDARRTLAMRHRNRLTLLIERLAYLPMALPGLVIALGLVVVLRALRASRSTRARSS